MDIDYKQKKVILNTYYYTCHYNYLQATSNYYHYCDQTFIVLHYTFVLYVEF